MTLLVIFSSILLLFTRSWCHERAFLVTVRHSPSVADGVQTSLQVSSSGPFVAGELDPAEIEICRDASGGKVVLGEGAFGRVSPSCFQCAS